MPPSTDRASARSCICILWIPTMRAASSNRPPPLPPPPPPPAEVEPVFRARRFGGVGAREARQVPLDDRRRVPPVAHPHSPIPRRRASLSPPPHTVLPLHCTAADGHLLSVLPLLEPKPPLPPKSPRCSIFGPLAWSGSAKAGREERGGTSLGGCRGGQALRQGHEEPELHDSCSVSDAVRRCPLPQAEPRDLLL